MRQRQLEMRLQALEGFPEPKAHLEQYPTPARIAADILYTAHAQGDIEGRSVLDLGCGTGIFAIGASLLGAARVAAADIDEGAIATAQRNAAGLGCDIEFLLSAVEDVTGTYDTCLMNPPFGAQSRHADLPFLDKAMEASGVVYSLHNADTIPFISARAEKAGRRVSLERTYKFEIRHTFDFHTRDKAVFDVTMIRLVRG